MEGTCSSFDPLRWQSALSGRLMGPPLSNVVTQLLSVVSKLWVHVLLLTLHQGFNRLFLIQEVAPPLSEEPTRGFIVPNVTLPPLCSSQIKSGPPGETAQAATQFVAELVKNNLIIDLEKLCVKESKWAWVLYVDLLCLNLDGALLDTCIIALVAAMKDC